jgi:hypothetical protein
MTKEEWVEEIGREYDNYHALKAAGDMIGAKEAFNRFNAARKAAFGGDNAKV